MMANNNHGGKRAGAGRKAGTTKAEGLPTHVVRISTEITKEQAQALPSLIAVFDYWEKECAKNPLSARHYFLKQMIEEIRSLGY